MAATEAVVSPILKEVYEGGIEDELNNASELWFLLEKTKETVGGYGKRVVRPMRVTRNTGVGSRPDNGTLPNPGNQTFIDAQINPASTYLMGQITGRTIRSAATDTASFERPLEAEIRFGMTDLVRDLGRQLFMGAGQVTTVNGTVTASTTVVVKDVTNLGIGMVVEFFNSGTNQTTADSGLTYGSAIAAINTSTLTLTMTTAQTITSGATVARVGNNTAATTTYEMNGLDTTIDDNTDYSGRAYFGINRATYPVTYGNRLDASVNNTTILGGDTATILNENKLQYMMDQAKMNGGYTDLIISDLNTRRKYSNLLESNKRYPVEGINAPQFAGGFQRSQDLLRGVGDGLSYGGAPWIASTECPTGKAFGLDMKSWELIQQSEIEWVQDDAGTVLFSLINASPRTDAFTYSLYYDANLYCSAPNRNWKMVNC
jgi:hypothetical protein